MARLYADEHVPLAVISALRRSGHDVARARENFPEGTKDEEQFEAAIRAERLFLTQDADFLALSVSVLSRGRHHPGIVYWPQGTYGLGQVIRRLRKYLSTTTNDSRKDVVKFL